VNSIINANKQNWNTLSRLLNLHNIFLSTTKSTSIAKTNNHKIISVYIFTSWNENKDDDNDGFDGDDQTSKFSIQITNYTIKWRLHHSYLNTRFDNESFFFIIRVFSIGNCLLSKSVTHNNNKINKLIPYCLIIVWMLCQVGAKYR
jgi:hypothetical protein